MLLSMTYSGECSVGKNGIVIAVCHASEHEQ